MIDAPKPEIARNRRKLSEVKKNLNKIQVLCSRINLNKNKTSMFSIIESYRFISKPIRQKITLQFNNVCKVQTIIIKNKVLTK